MFPWSLLVVDKWKSFGLPLGEQMAKYQFYHQTHTQTLLLSKNIPNLEEMGVVERRPRWSSSSGSSGGSEQHAGDIPRWGVSGQGVEARELTPLSFL